MDKELIIRKLRNNVYLLHKHIDALSEERFVEDQSPKWGACQQMEHLVMSAKAVNLAFYLPSFLPRILFGKNLRSKTYDTIVSLYKAELENGAKSSKKFEPKNTSTFKDKQKALEASLKVHHKLMKNIENIEDITFETICIPHPILGKITFKEMVYFTIFHIEYHTHSIKELHEKQSDGQT